MGKVFYKGAHEISAPTITITRNGDFIVSAIASSEAALFKIRVGRSDGPGTITDDGAEIYDFGNHIVIIYSDGNIMNAMSNFIPSYRSVDMIMHVE